MPTTNPLEHTQMEHTQSKTKSLDASEKSSSQVYSDPAQFLAVLQTDYNKIASNPDRGITLPDLKLYALDGSDAAGREAAKTLAANFSAAMNMFKTNEGLANPNNDLTLDSPPNKSITLSEITDEQKLVSGKYKSMLLDSRQNVVMVELMAGTAAIALTGFTAVSIAAPPFAPVIAVAAVGAAALTAWEVKKNNDLSTDFKNAASDGNKLISSWKKS